MAFVKATKHEAKLRLALAGPSGFGKTYTALQLATHLGGPIAVVDTERGCARKYADLFPFDVLELDSFHPQGYIDAIHYRPGLVVQFSQNAPGITNGKRFRVEEVHAGELLLISPDGREATLLLRHTGRFHVYEPSRLGLAAGDTIRVTQNYRLARDGYRLDNGTLCQVKTFTDKGELVLTNGRKLGADFAHFTHGYVTTSYASQGSSVDRVLIAQGSESFPASSREQIYVSASRGKKQARIYTDYKEALKERIRESGERASATELLEGEVTACMKPRRIEEVLRERAARIRRYFTQREKVLAAKTPHLVKDRTQEQAAEKERSSYGAAMER